MNQSIKVFFSTHIQPSIYYLSIFLILIGIKLYYIADFSYYTPFWDEFDTIGYQTLKPFTESTLTWTSLFAHHNEHIILFTKLNSIVLFYFNQLWDPQLEMIGNCIIHSLSALILLGIASHKHSKATKYSLSILTIVCFAFPYSYISTLVAFQSQFYYFIFFTIISFYLLYNSNINSKMWWVGLIPLVLSFLCMSTGMIPVIALIVYYLIQSPRTNKLEIIVLSFLLVLEIYLTPSVPGHRVYVAQSILAFLVFTLKSVSWPFSNFSGALLLFLPYIRYTICHAKQKKSKNFFILLGIFLLVNSIIIGLMRAKNGLHSVPNRYIEILVLAVFLNGYCLSRLLVFDSSKLKRAFALIWVVLVSTSLHNRLEYSYNFGMPLRLHQNKSAELVIKNYLRTNKQSELQNKPSYHVPFPSVPHLELMLTDRTMLQLLAIDSSYQKSKIETGKLFKLKNKLLHTPMILLLGIFFLVLYGVMALRNNFAKKLPITQETSV